MFLDYQCVQSARVSKVSHEPLRKETSTHIGVASLGLFSFSVFQLHSSCLTFSVKIHNRHMRTTAMASVSDITVFLVIKRIEEICFIAILS